MEIVRTKGDSSELQLGADKGGWILIEQSSISPDEARSGQLSMLNAGFSRTVAYPPYFVGNVSGSYQEFPADPDSRWRLTGFGMMPSALQGTPAFGIVQVPFFGTQGDDLGTVETAGIATAPEGTVIVQAFTLYVDFSGTDKAQGAYFDDLNLCALEDDDESACH